MSDFKFDRQGQTFLISVFCFLTQYSDLLATPKPFFGHSCVVAEYVP